MNRRSSKMGYFIYGVFWLAAILCLPAAAQEGAQEQEPLRLNATLVQVPTVVLDRQGRFIGDLTRDDFVVLENGKRQEIALFAPLKQPFTAVLVLDTSNSAADRLRVIQSAALDFARALQPGDRIMVIAFDHEFRQLTDFTDDFAEIEAAVCGVESGFGKLLYEAVSRGLEQLREVEGRRAVILFSDGVDMKSIETDAERTMKLAEEIGAVIYSVRFDTRWWIEAEARKQKAENREASAPFSHDGRIPLPPEYGGPDPNDIPGVRRPKIEVGTPSSTPKVTIIDGMGRRQSEPEKPKDEINLTLDKLYGEAEAFMQTAAARTGGQVFRPETFADTRSAFAAIADELRNQYLIGFYATNEKRDGRLRKLKVEVKRKDLRVRARQGYRFSL